MTSVPAPTMPSREVWNAGGLRELYHQERWSLVRLASILLQDPVEAEEVVQDAFVRALLAWGRLREPDKAAAYLRSAVLNGARDRLRHQKVVARLQPGPTDAGRPSDRRPQSPQTPEAAAVAADDRRRVLAALRALPERQRECLILRYYLDLSEAEIAVTLGISAGSVKSHAHRGLAALASKLEVSR